MLMNCFSFMTKIQNYKENIKGKQKSDDVLIGTPNSDLNAELSGLGTTSSTGFNGKT